MGYSSSSRHCTFVGYYSVAANSTTVYAVLGDTDYAGSSYVSVDAGVSWTPHVIATFKPVGLAASDTCIIVLGIMDSTRQPYIGLLMELHSLWSTICGPMVSRQDFLIMPHLDLMKVYLLLRTVTWELQVIYNT